MNYLLKLNWDLKQETSGKRKGGEGEQEEEKIIFTGSHGKLILVLDSNEDLQYMEEKKAKQRRAKQRIIYQ